MSKSTTPRAPSSTPTASSPSPLFTATAVVTLTTVALCVCANIFGHHLLEDFVRSPECRTNWDHAKWTAEAAFSAAATVPPPTSKENATSDWKCSIAQWFAGPFMFSTETSAAPSSSSSPSLTSMGVLLLLSSTAFTGRNLAPIIIWCTAGLVFPTLRGSSMEFFTLLALLTQTVAGSGVAANAPRSVVPLLSFGAAVVWVCYLAFVSSGTLSSSSSFSSSSSSASASAVGLNPVLWGAVPLNLLLQTAGSIAARRKLALAISLLACAAAVWIGVVALSNSLRFDSRWAAAVVHRARVYGVELDASVQEMAWMPGSMLGELLVYGFRGSAAATILFVSLLPSALVLISATRLRTDVETSLFFCVLCDPRTTLAHFAIVAMLMHRRVEPRRNNDDDSQVTRNSGAARILRLYLGVAPIFVAIISVAYFVAWGVYRSAQQNMSLYALFGVHLMCSVWILADLEPLDLEKEN